MKTVPFNRDFEQMLISAERYALGRATYIVSATVEYIESFRKELSDWCGTVLIVDEIKSWGVQAFVHIPTQGDAYIRLTPDQYEVLGGEAVLMPGGDDE